MAAKGRKPSLAILIDAENTSAHHANAIFSEIANLGEATVRRIYGNFNGERLKSWRKKVRPLQLDLRQQSKKTPHKNAADIALVVEAMDLMHQGGMDGYCLISSDSDFTSLAQRLRESGAKVFGFGNGSAPIALRKACTCFIAIETLPTKVQSNKNTKAVADCNSKTEPLSKAERLICTVMAQTWKRRMWVDLNEFERRLKLHAADFDPRTYGCADLETLVEKIDKFDFARPQGKGVRIKRRRLSSG